MTDEKQPAKLPGEVWRGEGYDGPAAVAMVGGSPVSYWLAPDGWHAASGAREVYALRFALAHEHAVAAAERALRKAEGREQAAFDAVTAFVPNDVGIAPFAAALVTAEEETERCQAALRALGVDPDGEP